jgi:hypothetical protein
MEKNLQDHPLHHKIIKISLFLGSSLLNAPMSGKIQFKFLCFSLGHLVTEVLALNLSMREIDFSLFSPR